MYVAEIAILAELESRGIKFPAGFAEYLQTFAALSPGTVSYYMNIIGRVLGKKGILSIDKAAKYIGSHNRMYSKAAIFKLLDYLEYAGVMSDTDAMIWKKRLPKVKEAAPRPKDIPDPAMIQKAIGFLDREERLIAQFLFYTGCRIHEALGIKFSDIDFQTGKAVVYGKGRKEKKPRMVKLPDSYLAELEKIKQAAGILPSENIFYSDNRIKIHSKTDMFRRKLRAASLKASGKFSSSHDFRRIVATRILEQTGDLQLAKTALGHEKLETTLRYSKFVDTEKSLDRVRSIMESAASDGQAQEPHRHDGGDRVRQEAELHVPAAQPVVQPGDKDGHAEDRPENDGAPEGRDHEPGRDEDKGKPENVAEPDTAQKGRFLDHKEAQEASSQGETGTKKQPEKREIHEIEQKEPDWNLLIDEVQDSEDDTVDEDY